MVQDIKIKDFDYGLPDGRIARHPLEERDSCRLLAAGTVGKPDHRVFRDLPSLLPPGSIVICNDTRVINARMEFRKDSGARVEIFLLEPLEPSDYVLTFQTGGECVWNCMVGNLKRWKGGDLTMTVSLQGAHGPVTLRATRLHDTGGNAHAVRFSWDRSDVTFASVVQAAGNIPIPPYLKRESEESDTQDYQTVYADAKGSVAAPTAGLHFTPQVIGDMEARGIPLLKLTLHVGAGTFQPVKSEEIGGHPMHTETFTVTLALMRRLLQQKREGLPVVAVGTTSVRTLESLPYIGAAIARGAELHVTQWEAYETAAQSLDTLQALTAIVQYMEQRGLDRLTCSTSIMIAPGFNWRIVDAMVTNFHQPQSTLLLLVSSFLGAEPGDTEPRWRRLYDEALDHGYRFLSYGDACYFSRIAQGDPITLPVSKSIGARWLVASYFAGTLAQCPRLEDCDDLRAIQSALLELELNRGWPAAGCRPVDVHASGTAFRLMAAATASTPGADFLLTGTPRLCSRPMAPLLDVLRQAGARIEAQGPGDTGPYRILGRRLRGGEFAIRGDVSSQFISALMLAAPAWQGGMHLEFATPLVSRPYAEMTAAVMQRFGAPVRWTESGVTVAQGEYIAPRGFDIEADWSAAGFFYEAALLGARDVLLAGLTPPGDSLQGDSATCWIFERVGVETAWERGVARLHRRGALPGEINMEMTDNPDLVPAFAVGAALAGIRFRFWGVRNLRVKESDRLEALRVEMERLGYVLEVGEDTLQWKGERCAPSESDPLIRTYDDHRIAMAFAMAAIVRGRIRIEHPQVVDKSFAGFWQQLPKLGLTCHRAGDVMEVSAS